MSARPAGEAIWLPPGVMICSARRRLAAYLLDGIVLGVTFVVGWYAWTLLRYRGIPGPGKQLLRMRVVVQRTGAAPSLRRTGVRWLAKWLLLSQGVGLLLYLLTFSERAARSLDVVPDRWLSATATGLAVVAQLIVLLVTTCWLLWDRQRQELWDKIAGTLVLHDADVRPER